ncbi:putative membrane protein [Mucilaginibacter sp. UYNi724]
MQHVTEPKKNLLLRLDAHYRLYLSLLIGAVVFYLARHNPSVPAVTLITWIAVASSIIILDWVTILWAHPKDIRKVASLEDSSRVMIFVFVMAASLVSLVAMLLLLKSAKGASDDTVAGYILLAMTAVVISWWLVHTVFTMRYAHLYYTTDKGKKTPLGGLEFPGDDKEPDYLDFVYFSFVVGMTFQVSDVEISSKHIRRLALAHGLIAFAFNTAIVALSINVISGLVSK